MEEKIKDIFIKITGKDISDISDKTKLKKMGLSSLSVVELVCAIEDEFDIEIPNSQIRKFKTVKDIMKFIENEAG